MKIKSIKSIVLPIMIISIIFISNFTAFAVGTRLVDNDTIDQFCYNERSGFNSYMSYGYLYNGDARINNSSTSENYYLWGYYSTLYPPLGVNFMDVRLGVFLNHAKFTDPAARYAVQDVPYNQYTMAYINQRLAPSGWTYNFRRIELFSVAPKFHSHYTVLTPSGVSNYETGADSIRIEYLN